MPTIPKLSDLNRQAALKKKAEREKRYRLDQTRSGNAAKFYQSKVWTNARNSYLHTHPVDELMLITHKVTSADNVHHLIKFIDQATDELRWRLLVDPDNLISLESHTHQMIHYSPDSLTEE